MVLWAVVYVSDGVLGGVTECLGNTLKPTPWLPSYHTVARACAENGRFRVDSFTPFTWGCYHSGLYPADGRGKVEEEGVVSFRLPQGFRDRLGGQREPPYS